MSSSIGARVPRSNESSILFELFSFKQCPQCSQIFNSYNLIDNNFCIEPTNARTHTYIYIYILDGIAWPPL